MADKDVVSLTSGRSSLLSLRNIYPLSIFYINRNLLRNSTLAFNSQVFFVARRAFVERVFEDWLGPGKA